MMDIYIAAIDTMILAVVGAETYITWQYLSFNHRQRIKRQMGKLFKSLGVR